MLMNSVICRLVLRILRPMESVLKLATLRKTLLGQAGLAMRWDLVSKVARSRSCLVRRSLRALRCRAARRPDIERCSFWWVLLAMLGGRRRKLTRLKSAHPFDRAQRRARASASYAQGLLLRLIQ